MFNLFDEDRTGKITFKNLKKVSTELGEPLNDDELMEMIARADNDKDGEVSFDEFFNIMTKKIFP